MAKLYNTLLLFTALTIAGNTLASDDPLVEVSKTFSKSFNVSSGEKLSLANKFGEMKVHTWNKNEVKIDITMRAEAGSEELANKILDKISILENKSSGGYYFKTKIGDMDETKRWRKGEKQGFQINYVVYMPSQNPLYASNEFGAMEIDDRSGEVELQSKFGSLKAGKLGNVKEIEVEFGTAVVESVNRGDLTVKFSRADVRNLDGNVEAKFEHSSIRLAVSNKTQGLDIKNSFTRLNLDCSTNLSADFVINTSFAEVKNKTNFNIRKEGEDDEERGPKFDFRYSGKCGSGNTPIKIKTSFGDVILGHNIPFDVNQKEEKKDKEEKKRTRNI